MSNTPNFSSILDEAPTEVVVPPPLPIGSYIAVVQGLPRIDKSAKKGTEFTEFTLRPISANEDVDQEQLEAAGGFEGKTYKLTFYHTEDAIYRLDQFHEHCGIDLSNPLSRRRRSEEVVNAEVGIFITHSTSQDGTRIYANISRTFPV